MTNILKTNPISLKMRDILTDNIFSEKEYIYTYDTDDFPISRTDGTQTLTFEYY